MGKTGITYNDLTYLSVDELVKIAESKDEEVKTYWEQSRMVSFWAFRGHAKKTFKPKDVIKFPWDKNKEMSQEKINLVKANASKLRELIKSGKVKFKA